MTARETFTRPFLPGSTQQPGPPFQDLMWALNGPESDDTHNKGTHSHGNYVQSHFRHPFGPFFSAMTVAVSCGYSTCFAISACDGLCHLTKVMDRVGTPLHSEIDQIHLGIEA